MIKRYLVFSGDIYYPRGGWKDFDSSFDTYEGADEYRKSLSRDWFEIVDLQTAEVKDEW